MTKRWERELRRLDDVNAPTERIRAHAADRPTDPSHGDGLPPRRQRITAGVVAVVVFVAAGTFAWQAFRPGDDNADVIDPGPGAEVAISLVAEQSDGRSSPRASLQSGSDVTEGVSSSFSWQDGNSIMYADAVEPRFSPEEFVPIPLPASLVVNGDAAESHLWLERPGAYPFEEVRYLGESQDQPIAFNESGRFILHVRASWPQGDVSFYFPIELVPQVVNPATLSFIAKDSPEGHLQYGGVGFQTGVRGEYQWCDGTDTCEGGIPEFPTYPPVSKFMEILPGTLLMLESPVPSIKGGFLTMEGEKASPTFEDPRDLGLVPTEPGKYALEVHVAFDGDNGAHGSATFWFGVEVVDAASTAADPEISLADTGWHVAKVDGSSLPDEMADASLVFGDTTVSGWTGCNGFETSFEVADMHLVTGGGAVTQVACDPQEADLLEVIFNDPWIEMDDSRLVLTGPDGRTVELLEADAAPVDELRVSCQPSTTQVLDTTVVAGPSGVMVNLPDAGHADKVRFEALEEQEMSGLEVPLQTHPSRYPISLEPGSWSIECAAPEPGHESTVRIQVLDPGDLWASPGVACEGAHRVDVTLQPAASTFEGAVRQALDLLQGDVVRPPTYPRAATTLNLPVHLVVVRDGGTIAALDVWQERVQGDVCDDANLEYAP